MFGPISESNKIEKIIAALTSHIVGGKLKSGTELPSEKELALKLGVSRFSLREALRVAEAQGLIEISRGRKAKVAQPNAQAAAAIISLSIRRSRNTLLDLAEARHVLETHIARVAAKKITIASIKALERTVQLIAENPKNLDLCLAQDIEFHEILVRATGNTVFEIMLAPLAELLRESRRRTMSADIQSVIDEHEKIVEALRARSPEKAARRMARHLDLAVERQLGKK
jgi:GntR family transcriptional regulator, transcriptional repressor for pyruvate dehydrogenase complex